MGLICFVYSIQPISFFLFRYTIFLFFFFSSTESTPYFCPKPVYWTTQDLELFWLCQQQNFVINLLYYVLHIKRKLVTSSQHQQATSTNTLAYERLQYRRHIHDLNWLAGILQHDRVLCRINFPDIDILALLFVFVQTVHLRIDWTLQGDQASGSRCCRQKN